MSASGRRREAGFATTQGMCCLAGSGAAGRPRSAGRAALRREAMACCARRACGSIGSTRSGSAGSRGLWSWQERPFRCLGHRELCRPSGSSARRCWSGGGGARRAGCPATAQPRNGPLTNQARILARVLQRLARRRAALIATDILVLDQAIAAAVAADQAMAARAACCARSGVGRCSPHPARAHADSAASRGGRRWCRSGSRRSLAKRNLQRSAPHPRQTQTLARCGLHGRLVAGQPTPSWPPSNSESPPPETPKGHHRRDHPKLIVALNAMVRSIQPWTA